jgi:hypothetical protein
MGSMIFEVSRLEFSITIAWLIRCESSGWTLRGAVQKHIDIYVSHHTFSEVERSFPYLVSKKFASGGGDVSASRHIYRTWMLTYMATGT